MLPQVIENMRQKRVKGLSHLLVGLNNVGDLMKLAFFVLNVYYMLFRINLSNSLYAEYFNALSMDLSYFKYAIINPTNKMQKLMK